MDICRNITQLPNNFYMRKIILTVFIALLCSFSAFAHDFSPSRNDRFDATGRRHYFIALHATNPLGAASKIGAGLELRKLNTAYIFTYKMYYGAFQGKQYGIEYEHFFTGRKRHQYFFYLKGILSDSVTFINNKLSLFGQTQDIVVGPQAYFGAGAGMGRRYNFNVLFFDWQLGFKYCTLSGDLGKDESEYKKAQQNMFRLFRFTGPGSIVDFHFTVGIQL